MLAGMTCCKMAPVIHVPTAKQLELRASCRHRSTSVLNRTRTKNNILSILALHCFSVDLTYTVFRGSKRYCNKI